MQIEMVAGWIGSGLGYAMLALVMITCAWLIVLGAVVIARSIARSKPLPAKAVRRPKRVVAHLPV